jgi:hypothetical protein
MELAQGDPLRLERIWNTVPVRTGLEAFVLLLRRRAIDEFRHDQMVYVNGGYKKAPKPPAILRMAPRTKRHREFREPEKPAFIRALEDRENSE